MTKPTVDISIISANYNNGRYLDAFIRSVMESSMLPHELIIVDDGSSDDSREVLAKHTGLPFLITIFFEENQGFTAALNAALEAASGKYIMRADPDDLLMPDRIEKQFNYLENNPEIDVLGSNAIYFSDDGQQINRTNFPLHHDCISDTYHKGEHGVLHATVCGKRAVYQQYRYQPLSPGEDYELFARMVKDGWRFATLNEALYMVRVHRESASSQISREAIDRTFQFRDQIFGTRTSQYQVWMYWSHIRFYRKALISNNFFRKHANLFVSILFYPGKLIKRLWQKKDKKDV
jgi:glycosyltransferase involved in cell wall biosynthesis